MRNFVKENQIKDYLKEKNICLGIDFIEGLNQEVEYLTSKAISRAMKNSRKTIYGRDV
ncbi:DUF1931 domain-containing protein [Candidatus Woesearchaeota archaeon]|nr:DUF1931 domain-containing protein [Candidatus Woesearchaeota archaeon]